MKNSEMRWLDKKKSWKNRWTQERIRNKKENFEKLKIKLDGTQEQVNPRETKVGRRKTNLQSKIKKIWEKW